MSNVTNPSSPPPTSLNREIVSLAVPALGALLAEPLFVAVDSAVVGHLGVAQLAGLTAAGTVLNTVVGLCIFLAYATTASVARMIGQGNNAEALSRGIDGVWLALGLGVVLLGIGYGADDAILSGLGVTDAVRPFALDYLRWSLPGLPGMLVVLAVTGALRGMRQTKQTLYVAVSGAVLNAGLCVFFVYGMGWGIAGSGAATALTQTLMAVVLCVLMVRFAQHGGRTDANTIGGTEGWAASAVSQRVRWLPDFRGILAAARAGGPLFVRTVFLRICLVATMSVAALSGEVALAAHQVVMSIWNIAAMGSDALAIAAQVLIASAIGTKDPLALRNVTKRLMIWGTVAGVVMCIVIASLAGILPWLFTADEAVRHAATVSLLASAACIPLGSYAFIVDGLLMGASEGPYLAGAGAVAMIVYVPMLWAVVTWAVPQGSAGLPWIWLAYAGGYMAARAIVNSLRFRSEHWHNLVR